MTFSTYGGRLLSIDRLHVPATSYYRLLMRLDDPAGAKSIRAAPYQTAVRLRDESGRVITYQGLILVEDEATGIISGNFNLSATARQR